MLAGDLFATPFPERADVQVLKFVLIVLEVEVAVKAFRRYREVGGGVAETSRIVVIERTLREYASLARSAGLRLHAATPLAVGPHLIELRREG